MIKHERGEGTWLTRLFGLIATGHKVQVDDVDRSDPDLYGVHGLGEGDLDFIMAEHTRRKHDDLMKAMVPGTMPEDPADIIPDVDVDEEMAIEKPKAAAAARRKKTEEIFELMREISILAKKKRRTK